MLFEVACPSADPGTSATAFAAHGIGASVTNEQPVIPPPSDEAENVVRALPASETVVRLNPSIRQELLDCR